MSNLLDRIPDSVFQIIAFVIIISFLITIIFPLYFMTITAFKLEREIYSELTWFPRQPTLQNFRDVIGSFRIPIYVRNSAIVALSTTGIVLVIATLAAYSLTRLRYPGRSAMARGVLFVYLIPGSLMFIPMYMIIIKLRLQDTYLGLIVTNMTFNVPFCTWLLMGYLRNISIEMEEATLINDCTRLSSL